MMIRSAAYKAGINLYFYKACSLSAIAFAAYLMTRYPEAGWLSVLTLVISLIALFWNYKAGLFLLAALLPILDFGIWTGNILFSEYDILFLLIVSVLFWNKKPLSHQFKFEIFFFIIFFWFLLCSLIGFWDYISSYSADDVYQSPFNSIRVGKGFLAAWLTWYLVRAELIEDTRSTMMWLGAGVLCGLFLLTLAILWERHVFSAMAGASNFYDLMAAILDFSTSYRITGLFSGMHVGGTALDGYLVSVLPLAFYVLIRQKTKLFSAAAIVVFCLGIYGILVTFTRMTIASFSVSFAVSVMLLFFHNKQHDNQRAVHGHGIAYLVLFVAVTLVLAYLQKQAGYQALASGLLVFFASAIACHNRRLNVVIGVALTVFFLFGAYGINDSIRDSQWHQDTSARDALLNGLVMAAVLTVFGLSIGKLLTRDGLKWQVLGLPAIIGGGILMIIIGMGSSRMTARMQGVSTDLQTRTHHWVEVIDSAQSDSILRSLWGFGMGSMPKLYYQSHFDKMPLPTHQWAIQDGKTVLEIGKGGYPYYQKLSLEPGRDYTLSAIVKFDGEGGRLGLDICHKHILFSEQWQPDCVEKDYRATTSSWQKLEWVFNSGRLGSKGWLDWPPTLQIHNYGESVAVLDSIEIRDNQGRQLVKNPSFDKKLNHWFWGSDFEHLPWHSKQIFIQIWLEQGWIGLLLFGVLIGFGISHQLTLFKAGATIPIALIPSVLAILGLGLTDTFIDEPQTTLMVFFVLFAALQWPHSVRQFKPVR